jgi:hypothetical protein
VFGLVWLVCFVLVGSDRSLSGDIDLDTLLKLFEQHGFPLHLKGIVFFFLFRNWAIFSVPSHFQDKSVTQRSLAA